MSQIPAPDPVFSQTAEAAASREPSAGTASKRYGIAIVGNDKIIDWLLPFLESYRATNSGLPIYLIPYDDNIATDPPGGGDLRRAFRRGGAYRDRQARARALSGHIQQ